MEDGSEINSVNDFEILRKFSYSSGFFEDDESSNHVFATSTSCVL